MIDEKQKLRRINFKTLSGRIRMSVVKMKLNGKAVSGEVEGRTLLVEFIREHQRLTGTHGLRHQPMRRLRCAYKWQSD